MIIFGTRWIMFMLSSGAFHCPRCNRNTNYHLMQPRQWFTLFFIPIFPFKNKEAYVHCTTCNSDFYEEVLQTNASMMKKQQPEHIQSNNTSTPAISEVQAIKSTPTSNGYHLGLSLVDDVMNLPHIYNAMSESDTSIKGLLTEDFSDVLKEFSSFTFPSTLGEFHYAIKPDILLLPQDGSLVNRHLVPDEVSPRVMDMTFVFYEYGVYIIYGSKTGTIVWDEIRNVMFANNANNPEELRTLVIGFHEDIKSLDTWMIKDDMLAFCLFGILVKFKVDHGADIKITEV